MTKDTKDHIERLKQEYHDFMNDYESPLREELDEMSVILDKVIDNQKKNIEILEQMKVNQEMLLKLLNSKKDD